MRIMPDSRRLCRLVFAFVVLLSGQVVTSAAQDDAEDSPYRPGLLRTYSADNKTAVRTDEVVAFDWQDAACDARVRPGDFRATWRGRLWARGAGKYVIACYVQGDVAIQLAGQTVL